MHVNFLLAKFSPVFIAEPKPFFLFLVTFIKESFFLICSASLKELSEL